MQFSMKFKMDNAAFGDEPGFEVARILREVGERVGHGACDGNIRDANGNTVGTWKITGK